VFVFSCEVVLALQWIPRAVHAAANSKAIQIWQGFQTVVRQAPGTLHSARPPTTTKMSSNDERLNDGGLQPLI